MLIASWAALFAQQVVLASSTISGGAFSSFLSAVLACAAWACARLTAGRLLQGDGLQAREGGGDGHGVARIVFLASGVASTLAGIALAFSPGGFWSLVLLGASVFFACEVARVSLKRAALAGRAYIAKVVAATPVCIAVLHFAARTFSGVTGSFENAGAYAQVELVVVSLLPAAYALGSNALRRADVNRNRQPDQPEQLDRPDSKVGSSQRLAFAAAILVLLLGLMAFATSVFDGVVTAPYQVDMLLSGDVFALVLVLFGGVLLAIGRLAKGKPYVVAIVMIAVAVMAVLAGALAFAAYADPIAFAPLAIIRFACACLIISLWAAIALFMGSTPSRARSIGLVVGFIFVAVASRLGGGAMKQMVGLDSHTLTTFVLAGMALLVGALLVAVFAMTMSAQRTLNEVEEARRRSVERAEREKAEAVSRAESEKTRAVKRAEEEKTQAIQRSEEERARIVQKMEEEKANAVKEAAEQAVENMRHDPDYAIEALRQVYLDALSEFNLSEREAEIAALQLAGHTIDVIGEIAGISPNTVRFHLRNVYRKVDVVGKQALRTKIDERLGMSTPSDRG